jgi:hypothetical protein
MGYRFSEEIENAVVDRIVTAKKIPVLECSHTAFHTRCAACIVRRAQKMIETRTRAA